MSILQIGTQEAFSLWDTGAGALLRAGAELVWDFVTGNPKPWAYYPGVAAGVLANSEPGMGAVVYFIGSAIDVAYRKGPDASDIAWFVDGLAQTDLSAALAAEAWETFHLDGLVEGVVHKLEFRNIPSVTYPGNANIMALGGVTVTGTAPRASGFASELVSNVWEFKIVVKDAKNKTSTHTLYLPVAEYDYPAASYYANQYALAISELLDGVVKKVTLLREVGVADLPIEPQATADVEEGLKSIYNLNPTRFTFSATLATWKDAYLLPPDTFEHLRKPTFDPEVTAWRNLMTMAQTLGYPANPCDRRGLKITSYRKSYQVFKKSRK
ncbi:MAG: hypothetical protein JXB47_12810 [Anaerolineae bacterium]|nr:hypothetical protein [Anaerolineae bacterium]